MDDAKLTALLKAILSKGHIRRSRPNERDFLKPQLATLVA